jgi:hypothetical protein
MASQIPQGEKKINFAGNEKLPGTKTSQFRREVVMREVLNYPQKKTLFGKGCQSLDRMFDWPIRFLPLNGSQESNGPLPPPSLEADVQYPESFKYHRHDGTDGMSTVVVIDNN